MTTANSSVRGPDVLVEALEVGEGRGAVQHRLEDAALRGVGLEDGGHGCDAPEELGEDVGRGGRRACRRPWSRR